jgi:NADH:ubiquinone oxidoreductase subunit F (NADH-binding)
MAIAGHAVGVRAAFLCLKRSFETEIASVRRAHDELTAAGLLGSIPIELILGPEDYLFGEEKAMLEVIEGNQAMPREADLPPYVQGLFVNGPNELNPAVVNNVETLSNIPHIIRRGASWFRSIGTVDTPGTMVFTLSGDITTPGVYELPMGTPLRRLVFEYGGGPKPGRAIKVLFSGISNAVLLPTMLDTPADFGSLQKIGSGLGSGGFICLRRYGLHGANRPQVLGVSLRRIVRPMHALQARHESVDVLSAQTGARIGRTRRSRPRARGFRYGAARQSLLPAGRAFAADSVDRRQFRERVRRAL